MERLLWKHEEDGIKKGSLSAIMKVGVDSRPVLPRQSFLHVFMDPITFQTMCEEPDELTVVATFQIRGQQITANLSIPFQNIAALFTPPTP